MSVLQKGEESIAATLEKPDFTVFFGFRKPDGYVSVFADAVPKIGCGIYHKLATIFKREPQEIYESIHRASQGKGDVLMQKYLTLEEASTAMTNATLCTYRTKCGCLQRQQSFFYIC